MKGMLADLRRDTARYSARPAGLLKQALSNLYSHPAFAAVVFYRLGRWAWQGRRNPVLMIVYVAYRLIYPLVRWHSGVELQARTNIGPGLCLMHFGPIVIHPDASAGEDLTILPGVTIGAGSHGTPSLGDRVSIGTGATIIGGVKIGHDVNIGAGAVVVHDVPSCCTAVGVPAKALVREPVQQEPASDEPVPTVMPVKSAIG